jgi:mitogen-activated protein kinase 15
MVDDIDERILKKFDINRKLGKGSYGVVWKARDKQTNKDVAVKKCFDTFRSNADAQRLDSSFVCN